MIETRVPIVAGENEFTVYAFNRDNVKSTDAVLSISGAKSFAARVRRTCSWWASVSMRIQNTT
jgi:hypothetical protein